MAEILNKAPPLWATVVNPRHYSDLASFQTAVKYHEELLMDLGERHDRHDRYSKGSSRRPPTQSRSYKVDSRSRTKPKFKDSKKKSARTYSVGWKNPKHSYPHPKDDSIISKGKTPADYGARGCIFCGSTKHWDRDCKHFKDSSTHKARTMFTDCSPDDMHAEAEYERCYLESREEYSSEESSSEESDTQETEAQEAKETSEESQPDF